MERIIFHIDVNSAYLSWSALEHKKEGSEVDLRLIPSIVGGDPKTRHGVVLAKSLPARAFGIETGEPVMTALKKCPDLVMVPPKRDKYLEYSRALMLLLHRHTPDIEQVSIDECFLDFGPISHRYPSPVDAAMEFKEEVKRELGFTVNVGIAPNKLLAKMASDFQKPDRIHTLYYEEIPGKMWPLPVEDLFTVGKSTAGRLHRLGIHTIGQLAAADVKILTSHFKSHGQRIWEYANGMDDTPVNSKEREASSIGNSMTLSEDCLTEEDASPILMGLCEKVASRLRKAGVLAATLHVEIKYATFRRVSHQSTLLSPADTTRGLYETALMLFRELWNGEPVRLLGVTASSLVRRGEPVQMSLFDLETPAGATPFDTGRQKKRVEEAPEVKEEKQSEVRVEMKAEVRVEMKAASTSGNPLKQKKLEQALDSIRARYGQDAVKRGSQMNSKDSHKGSW